jgi:hypothetical protein
MFYGVVWNLDTNVCVDTEREGRFDCVATFFVFLQICVWIANLFRNFYIFLLISCTDLETTIHGQKWARQPGTSWLLV